MEIFYDISQFLLMPVLALIYVLFVYSLIETGRFAGLWWMRMRRRSFYQQFIAGDADPDLHGYPITLFYSKTPSASLNEIETYALKRMEPVRVVTRVTPMLGLIATLIPMGPALMSLAENNVYSMSEHLRTAFTAVILGLAAASLTFWIASVKKRWFAEEICAIEKLRENGRGT